MILTSVDAKGILTTILSLSCCTLTKTITFSITITPHHTHWQGIHDTSDLVYDKGNGCGWYKIEWALKRGVAVDDTIGVVVEEGESVLSANCMQNLI